MLQLVVANSSPTCHVVSGPRIPCVSAEYVAANGFFVETDTCELSVTYCSVSVTLITELSGFAVLHDVPVDIYFPLVWFESRFVLAGKNFPTTSSVV